MMQLMTWYSISAQLVMEWEHQQQLLLTSLFIVSTKGLFYIYYY